MFRIGEFSRIARVSMRLLRHYDELGLLRPAHTDTSNGYRYYSAAQLSQLNRILVLRDLGLSLDQVARTVQTGISPAELRGMLTIRQAELEQAQQERARQLQNLAARISALEAESADLLDDVVFRAEPARRFVSVRSQQPSFASAVSLALELQRELPRQIQPQVLGPFIVVLHSPEFEPDDLDLELGFVLEAEPTHVPSSCAGRRLELSTLPGYEHVASCVRVGSPELAHLTTGRIARQLEAGGYRLAGPNRETFLKLPRDGQVDTAIVEMAFPITARAD